MKKKNLYTREAVQGLQETTIKNGGEIVTRDGATAYIIPGMKTIIIKPFGRIPGVLEMCYTARQYNETPKKYT